MADDSILYCGLSTRWNNNNSHNSTFNVRCSMFVNVKVTIIPFTYSAKDLK